MISLILYHSRRVEPVLIGSNIIGLVDQKLEHEGTVNLSDVPIFVWTSVQAISMLL
jgi:hypothetical protein